MICVRGGRLKREQLIRELQKEAKDAELHLLVDWARGKGGHCIVRLNGNFTVIKSGEISPLMAKIIRKQLGL
jgi:hypothetical protein